MYSQYSSFLESSSISYKKDLLLSEYSTFSVGGAARLAVFADSIDSLCRAIYEARRIGLRYTVVGNGSNILFSDSGFDGAVIFTSGCKGVDICENKIKADCGVSFTHLSSVACRSSLSGLEFAYGIPGTVGGAVYMNAGAYGGQVSDVLVSSFCFDAETGAVKRITAAEHAFDYRTSIYDKNPSLTVLSAEVELKSGDREEIRKTMDELMAKRRDKQPLEYPSAGSTFKRPIGHFAGKLIEDSGLKGYTVGGAQVSEKHAGFIINRGGATAHDILSLIEHVKETVLKNFGVELECEIKYIS